MSDTAIVIPVVPLDILAREIEALANDADGQVIGAAMRLRQLRKRIEAGEAGVGVKWFEWAPANIQLSISRLFELQTIAEATNPKEELERLRNLNRERVKKHREAKSKAERMREPERRDLIKWAKTAPIAEIRTQWTRISRATAVKYETIAVVPANDDAEHAA
jgi:hypothetical protein